MKKIKVFTLLMAMVGTFAMFGAPTPSSADVGNHTFFINGISTIPNQCEYVPHASGERDELGIPKPSTLPPTCKTNSAGAPITCSLARNTYPANLKPPCSGNLTAQDIPGVQGCFQAGSLADCGINTPTWFYGFCGQTYGGAGSGGTFTFGGSTFRIDRMGFPRGRGAWEFNGRMTGISGPHNGKSTTFRYYLAAFPNKLPSEAAACDLTYNLSSIEFTGVIQVPAPPVRVIRTKPGWHWCDTDVPFFAGTPGENC